MLTKIIEDFAQAWITLNPELIIQHLAQSFRYDSQWVFESLDYKGYVSYIRGKFETIRKTNSGPEVHIVTDAQSSLGKMLKLNQNGNIVYYRIEIENGKVIKGDLCMF